MNDPVPDPPTDDRPALRIFRPARPAKVYWIGRRKGTLARLARKYGLKPATVRKRLEYGWSVRDTFLTPVQVHVRRS